MAEIVHLHPITTLSETPESALEKAKEWGMDRCLILGFKEDNSVQFGGSFSEAGDILLLLELGKQYILGNHISTVNTNPDGVDQ